ncbi:MAG: diacylglycerol/lipid kinase family protein [Candidatus Polarisedimenticolia bacterium]
MTTMTTDPPAARPPAAHPPAATDRVSLRERRPGLVVVIGNPAAGASGRRVIRSATSFLRRYARRVEMGMTRARGDAEALCREAVAAGAEVVVAAGGDGTINEVVNGLAGTGATLGILPLGTANVLALETGVPLDPEAACRLILTGRPARIHLGMAGARRFLLMAGAGFDAEVVYGTADAWKRKMGKAAYVLAGFWTLIARPGPRITVTADGAGPLQATGVILGKARLYGGRFSVTPGARLDEPLLQACVFLGRGRVRRTRAALRVVRGTHAATRDVAIFKTDRLYVDSPERVHVHADGDLVGTLPMEFRVAPESLRVILPGPGTGGFADGGIAAGGGA